MTAPNVSMTILDGGLQKLPPSLVGLSVSVGVCSGGVANTLYKFNDNNVLRDTLGTGPAVEAAATKLSARKRGPAYVMKTATTNAGSQGAWTLSGTGVDPGVTSSGTPLDAYSVRVRIVLGGARATATFVISFDGGDTWSQEYVTAASVTTWAASTGLTILFATGIYVAGDVYHSTSTPPTFSTDDLGAALDALNADAARWEFFHVVGTPANMAAFNTLFAAVATKIEAFHAAKRYVHAILEMPDVSDATIAADSSFLALSNKFISPSAGFIEIVSPLTLRVSKRPAAWAYAARVASTNLQTDPGRVADGPLPDIVSSYRDERTATISLYDLGVSVLTTYSSDDAPGFYVCGGRQKVVSTSDFTDIMFTRVMCRAAKLAYSALLMLLNEDLETNKAPGTDEAPVGALTDEQAQSIENAVNAKLGVLVSDKQAQSAEIIIDRTNNVQSTSKIKYGVRLVARGYAHTIEGDIGFIPG